MKLNSKVRKFSGLFMMMLVVCMVLVSPALACPAGTDCLKTSADGNTYGMFSNITSLDSKTVEKHLQTALESNDVKKLIQALNERGYKLNQADAQGLSTTVKDTYYEGVGLPFTSTDNSQVILVAIIKDNKIIKVQASILHRDKDLFPTSADVLTVNGNTIETESATTESIIGVGAKAKIASIVSIVSTSPLSQLDQVTASSSSCSACKLLYDIACNVGCGVGMAVICALAGLTTGIGGVACTVVAGLVCYAIDLYGCDYGGQAACIVIGYC